MRLEIFALSLLMLSPVVALANPKPPEVRPRAQTVRDRTPKVRLHEQRPHQR